LTWRRVVRRAAVRDQVQSPGNGNGHFGHLSRCPFQNSSCILQIIGDALLFGLHEIEGKRIGVVSLKQLLTFCLQLFDTELLPGSVASVSFVE